MSCLFVVLAPIFIVKLPREKTITVGATLFFNCLVEKGKLQEYLVGFDTYPKVDLLLLFLMLYCDDVM